MTSYDPRLALRRAVATAILVAIVVLCVRAQAPTFRSGIDLIAVDVQVVNDKGVPVLGLGPSRFEVSINGKKREVVSADLLRFDDATLGAAVGSPLPPSTLNGTSLPNNDPHDGRVFVIAVDAMSFSALETASVRQAAHVFVDQLQPNDLVGFIAFPFGRTLDATTDRSALGLELDRLVGQGDPPAMSRFKLQPSEIVDLTSLPPEVQGSPSIADLQKRFPVQGRLLGEICAGADATCPREALREASTTAMMEEGMILRRVGAIRGMLRVMTKSSRRKVIVLISEGILASDRPGGRPDVEDMGRLIGEDAARSNSTIYVLHIDRQRANGMSAASSRRARVTDNAMRDSAIVAAPLNQMAAASGGTVFTVVQGGGEFAFDRILKETSAHYLLGVQPDASDRDGKPRSLKVKLESGVRGTIVRARPWVVVPAK